MNKQIHFLTKLIMIAAVFSVIAQAGAVTITETRFDNVAGEFNEQRAGVTNQDTLQQTHPDHLMVESMVYDGGWVESDGPMWGGVTAADAVKDAGSDWWAFGGMTTIGLDGVGDGYLDFRWKDEYEQHPAFDGWDLASISILIGDNTPGIDRVNYKFRVDVLSHDWSSWQTIDMSDDPGQQDWLEGGSDTIGIGTKIDIDDIGISDIRGFRITANQGWQAAYNNDGSVNENPFWGSTHISEIDVELVPEPSAILLLGIGGTMLNRRKRKVIV